MSAAEAERPDVVEKRVAFRKWAETVDPRRLVMVDESGITVGMRLRYGYARRGQRCIDRAPARHGRRLSLIGWIDSEGRGEVLHKWGTVKRPDFEAFCAQALVPALEKGDVVVWDNAKVHENVALRAAIEARGAQVKPLPPYSPDFNPIELLWSKLKHYVRKARADTDAALIAALYGAGARVQASDMAGWFAHCGYPPQSS